METWGRLGVFDLETTGVDVDTARIVSACVAVLDESGAIVARWDWLADPGIEIPEGAAAIHGITTDRARREGRPAAIVIAEITQAIRALLALGMPIVAYNAPYDLSLLDRECRRHYIPTLDDPTPIIDPLVLDKALDRYRKGKRTLEVTSALYGVTLDDAHDAGADAIAAGRVAQAILRAYPDELDVSLADLHGRQQTWYAEQAASFQKYIRKVRGDLDFVADTAWPVRPTAKGSPFLDTQPIPAPAPRPSLTVPTVDFGTGVLSLEPPRRDDPDSLFALPAQPEVARPPRTPRDEAAPSVVPLADPEVDPAELETPEDSELLETLQPLPLEFDDAPADNVADGGNAKGETDLVDPDETTSEPVEPVVTASVDHIVPAAEPVPADDEPPAVGSVRPEVERLAAGIVTDGAGRALLVRRVGGTSFTEASGPIAARESALAALRRHVLADLGITLDLDNTEYLGSHRAEPDDRAGVVVRAEIFALAVTDELVLGEGVDEVRWIDDAESHGVELAVFTRDTVLPLWTARRSSLF